MLCLWISHITSDSLLHFVEKRLSTRHTTYTSRGEESKMWRCHCSCSFLLWMNEWKNEWNEAHHRIFLYGYFQTHRRDSTIQQKSISFFFMTFASSHCSCIVVRYVHNTVRRSKANQTNSTTFSYFGWLFSFSHPHPLAASLAYFFLIF